MKVLLFTDLHVKASQLFWHRDLGLLTKAFRSLGHDAWLVVHPAQKPPSSIQNQTLKISKDPVIWASPSEARNPFWWQSQKPDLVILGLWTRPKYDSIRRAALTATCRVIERADSDGIRTASCGIKEYAQRRYDYCRDKAGRWPTWISVLFSLLYSFASILATPWIEARLAQTLKLLPALSVETPQAMNFWKKLAGKLGADPGRIHLIPHPIQTDIFYPGPPSAKKNHVISVGRWESYQKNLPLLFKTLASFLDQNPGWSALVVGSGLPRNPPHPQIYFFTHLTARALARRMRASKIYLSSSRYESFGIAAAEAALCACQVVAPRGCLPWWTGATYNQVADNLSSDLQKASKRRPPSRLVCMKIHRRLNPLEIVHQMLIKSRWPKAQTRLLR